LAISLRISVGFLPLQNKQSLFPKKFHGFESLNSEVDDDVPQFVVTSSEFGASLMSLLNLAEELGARSANSKFRKSTDRLRKLFAKTFIERYSLAKDQIKPIAEALSSIDRLGAYDSDMESLSDSILKEIEDVEGFASSIVFYNEPLPKLEELSFPFKYPHSTFDSIPSTLVKSDFDGMGYNISIPDIQAGLSAFERNFNVLKDGIVSNKLIYDNEKLISEMNKLKTGLRLENLIWRKESGKVMMSTATGISTLSSQAADNLISLGSQAKDGFQRWEVKQKMGFRHWEVKPKMGFRH